MSLLEMLGDDRASDQPQMSVTDAIASTFYMQVTGGCSSGGDGVSQPDSSGDGSDSADDTESGDDSSDSPANLSATPDCNAGGSDSSSSSTQFLAKGTSAGTITQGRCFQLFGGCLPNQCGNSQKPEDICNAQHAQCAGSCTVMCTDACSNT